MNHQPSTEAVIIGASAAGLYAAYLLAKGGVPVLLFDQQERIGPPARTLIVTPRLRDALGAIPREAIVNRTPVLRMFSPGCSTSVHLSAPDLVVEREKLLPLLVRQAKAAGVEILPGYRFLGLEADHDGMFVHLESSTGRRERLRTCTLIGADGAFSQVARAAERDGYRTVYNLQATVNMPHGASPNTTQIWFDPALTRYFFWLIPESRERGVAGLIADDEGQARASLAHFLSAQGLQPLGYQGGEVPLYRRNGLPWRRVGKTQVFMVGDAAAQVKVTTVGGLVAGLRGAQAAARAILRGGRYDQELGPLQRELDGHLCIRRVLNRFGPHEYDRLLSLVNARVGKVLATRTRDEAMRVLFAALLAQPGFLLLAARSLLGSGAATRQK